MDLGSISSAMSLSSASQSVDVGVLKALQNLDKTVTAQLFNSIGLGSQVDAFA